MDQPSLSIIPGVRAGSFLYHVNDGFFFVCKRRNGMTHYFLCSKWRSGCPATANLNSGYFHSSLLHNHAPDHLHVPLTLERTRLVNEASNLDYPTFGDIFRNTRSLDKIHIMDFNIMQRFLFNFCIVWLQEFVSRNINPTQLAACYGSHEDGFMAREAKNFT